MILPFVIHGSETWSLTQLHTKKLKVFENNCLLAILNIRLQDRVSTNEIREEDKQQNPIENAIQKLCLTWFGHVCRMSNESQQKRTMKEDFDKRRNRGRAHKRWLDLIKEDTGLPVATAEKYVKNKNGWRTNVNIKWAKPLSGVCNYVKSRKSSFVLYLRFFKDSQPTRISDLPPITS